MDNEFPTTLPAYCATFDISFFDLRLKCIFCKSYVTIVDLALFHEKCLQLLWKDKVCYCCCSRCLCLSAKYEVENFFQCSCKVDILHALLEKPLQDIVIRCYYCYQLLDLSSKFDLISRGKPACLVRGHWRAPCRNCLNRELWL